MEEKPKNKPILLIDMYVVIIKESKGYFIPTLMNILMSKSMTGLPGPFGRNACLRRLETEKSVLMNFFPG